jgi:hypothetical protein
LQGGDTPHQGELFREPDETHSEKTKRTSQG